MGIFDSINADFYMRGAKNNVPYRVICNSSLSFPDFTKLQQEPADEAGLDNITLSSREEKETVDENGIIKREVRNSEGKLIEVVYTMPNGEKEIDCYDENEQLKTSDVINPDGSHIFADHTQEEKSLKYYDVNGKLTKEKTFWDNGKERERLYDENENLLRSTVTIRERYKSWNNNPDGTSVKKKFRNGEQSLKGEYDKDKYLIYLEKQTDNGLISYDENVLKHLSSDTKRNLAETENLLISDRLKKDIDIVNTAEQEALKAGEKDSEEYKKVYDSYIKFHTVVPTDDLEDIPGEVVNEFDTLYVQNGDGYERLGISEDTYMDLFPLVKRYDINQQNVGDCYFLSPIINYMKNPKGYAEILKMFSEDENGNITVTFPGEPMKDYPVTFEGGALKEIDGQSNNCNYIEPSKVVNGAKGVQMLEQAFVIATYAHKMNLPVQDVDIDAAYNMINDMKGGYSDDVYRQFLNVPAERHSGDSGINEDFLNYYADKINNGSTLLHVSMYTEDENSKESVKVNEDYNIETKHAYFIEHIDPEKKVVYFTNPHFGGCTTVMPYDKFISTISDNGRKILVATVNM